MIDATLYGGRLQLHTLHCRYVVRDGVIEAAHGNLYWQGSNAFRDLPSEQRQAVIAIQEVRAFSKFIVPELEEHD